MFTGKKKMEERERERERLNDLQAGPSDTGDFFSTPEANIRKAIEAFCESGANQSDDEVLYLPVIVDSAEGSPTAAAEAARSIRKYLDTKYVAEPQLQYNAIMLMRILADHPGKTFTRNLDQRFADKLKDLFKHGRDPGVMQLLAETLDHFDTTKGEDEELQFVRALWQKQKASLAKYQTPSGSHRPGTLQQMVNARTSSRRPTGSCLPPMEELVGRVSEAQMSAKLLHQVLGSTPKNEVLENELVKEFVHRCRSASTSMADFITCDSPPPDPDTLQTLIETNDMIRIALARYDAIKEAIEMNRATPQVEAQVVVDPAARVMEPYLEDPFRDPQIPPPLIYPGGRHSSRSPAATGRVTRIDTSQSREPTSPVSPVSAETKTTFRY